MKSLKKTLVLLVVLSMIFSTLVPAFAATDVADLDCEDAVLRMEALEIIEGYEDGTFKPENTITRAEMAVIICKMTGITKAAADASANVDSKFSDVKAGEWYTGWINIATGNGIIAGFPDGTYRPNEVLTLNQVLTLAVKALGRGAYVDQMGTWPANYVTEAAKLGLLDDVSANSTDANRGNVAIIAWNTLQARMWDVENTKLDGEVSLGGNTGSTLLNTHFRAYCFNKDLKEVKDVAVTAVPSTNKEIGDRQIVLDILNSEETDFNYADAKAFDKAPNKNEDEVTYKTVDKDGDLVNVVAYVPENVYADLDELLGRKVTVIFGDDNEIALVIVEDDVVNNEYATKFKDEKLTVGGETYKFADNFELYVNNVEIDTEAVIADLEDVIVNILGDTYTATKDFQKKIKANVILNAKGKVSRLDLYVSGEFPEYLTTETVVGKVKNSVVYAQNGTSTIYDYDEVEEEDLPKVYVDGAKASIEDLKVGDVLTIYYTDADENGAYSDDEADTIYASRTTVAGAIAQVKNDRTFTVEGEAYTASVIDAANILLLEDEDIKDADKISAKTVDVQKAIKNLVDEDVTLYLNIYGEYVLVASQDVDTDYQFAIVEHIYETEEDSEDEDLFTQKLKLFMADGTSSRSFKVAYDKSEHEDDEEDTYKIADPLDKDYGIVGRIPADLDEGDFIAFSADANNEIDVEDIYNLTKEPAGFTDGYKAFKAVASSTTAYFEDEMLKIDTDNYRAKDTTVIFNYNEGNPDIIKWKALVEEANAENNNKDTLVADATIVCKENSKTMAYVFISVNEDDTAVSSSEFAGVLKTGYTSTIGSKTYYMTKILDANNNEVELKDDDRKAAEDYIIEYKTSNDKLSIANELLDIITVNELKDTDKMIGIYSGTADATLLHDNYVADEAAEHGTIIVPAQYAEHATTEKECNGTDCNDTCEGYVAEHYAISDAASALTVVFDAFDATTQVKLADVNAKRLDGADAFEVNDTVKLVAADHGTITTTECDGTDCEGTCENYVAEHYAISADADALEVVADGTTINEGELKITVSAANEKAPEGTTFEVANKVKLVSVVHGGERVDECEEETTDTCTCDEFVKEHYEASEDADALTVVFDAFDATTQVKLADANAKALEGTTFVVGNKVALVAEDHGTIVVECANVSNTTAITCDACQLVTPYVAAHEADCEENCTAEARCEGYTTYATSNIAKEAFRVESIEGKFLVYNDDEDLGENVLDDVKVDTEDVVVFDVTSGTPVVVEFSDIEVDDIVVAFGGSNNEATLLVIVK